MTTNLKAETLFNLPVMGATSGSVPNRARTAPRPFRVGWIAPTAILLAALLGLAASTVLAQVNANLDTVAATMEQPQF